VDEWDGMRRAVLDAGVAAGKREGRPRPEEVTMVDVEGNPDAVAACDIGTPAEVGTRCKSGRTGGPILPA
jgi:hypothetical protein